MNITNGSMLNFGAKLVACTSSKQKGDTPIYKIYKLENNTDDKECFFDMIHQWENPMLVVEALYNFDNCCPKDEFYVLKDKNKKCLGFAQISTRRNDCNELINIETMPSCAFRERKTNKKYIGETMLAFLLKRTQLDSQKDFVVPHTLKTAEGFYVDNCGFKHYKGGRVLSTYKPKEEFCEVIEKNEKHTGSKIELVC